MQAVVVTILKSLWVVVEPTLLPALGQLAADLIAKAKAAQLPDKYKFLEPILIAAENDILALFPKA